MKSKLQIEASLDQSLRQQVTMPRLDSRFNAAVWQRIAACEATAPAARRAASGASRWLLASNLIGVMVSVVLVVYGLTGVDVSLQLPAVPLPEMPAAADARLMSVLSWGITIAFVVFAFTFTGMGRRVRQLLRSEFA